MHRNVIPTALIAAALLLSSSLLHAAENKPAAPGEAISVPMPAKESAREKAAKAAAKVKYVDINSAGKAELKKLPGIGDAEADKIIAARPYLTKAHLVTHNIIPGMTYEGIKHLIVARQKQIAKAKPAK